MTLPFLKPEALAYRAKAHLKLNVQYQVFDKDGNVKPLFAFNKLGMWLFKKGYVSAFSRNPLLGDWTGVMNVANLVTNAGKAGVASRIGGSGSEAVFDYIAVGTGTTAAALGDTTLETETAASGLTRAQATQSRVTTDVTNDTAQSVKSFSVTGTVAVTESGLFNASSSGVLLARQVFSAINVVNGDTLQITWKIDVD